MKRQKKNKKKRERSVSRVCSVNNDGHLKEFSNKKDVGEIIMEHSKTDYQKPYGTPFLTGSLLQELVLKGNQHVVDKILEGIYVPKEDVENFTKKYIQQLKLPNGREIKNEIDPITIEKHKEELKQIKERVSSNPLFLWNLEGKCT